MKPMKVEKVLLNLSSFDSQQAENVVKDMFNMVELMK
jgi:hypothetical protein